MPKYFKVGRLYDKYFRLIGYEKRSHHIEIVLQVTDKDYLTRPKIADNCAKMIAKSVGIVELIKKSEIKTHKTGRLVPYIDDEGYVSEVEEALYYQIFYFKWRRRPKKG